MAKLYQCPKCKKRCEKLEYLQAHYAQKHDAYEKLVVAPAEPAFKCAHCNKGFDTENAMAEHGRAKHNREIKSEKFFAATKKSGRKYIGKKPPCPVHGSALEMRHGRYGHFFGCPHFPHCDITGSWSKHNGRFYITTQADRTARIAAHDAFDRIWQGGHKSRGATYAWLADQLGLEQKDCHMQHFDEETALYVARLCESFLAAAESTDERVLLAEV